MKPVKHAQEHMNTLFTCRIFKWRQRHNPEMRTIKNVMGYSSMQKIFLYILHFPKVLKDQSFISFFFFSFIFNIVLLFWVTRLKSFSALNFIVLNDVCDLFYFSLLQLGHWVLSSHEAKKGKQRIYTRILTATDTVQRMNKTLQSLIYFNVDETL